MNVVRYDNGNLTALAETGMNDRVESMALAGATGRYLRFFKCISPCPPIYCFLTLFFGD